MIKDSDLPSSASVASTKNGKFASKFPNFLPVITVIPLTVNKIASSGCFSPLNRSFPLKGSPLNRLLHVQLCLKFGKLE